MRKTLLIFIPLALFADQKIAPDLDLDSGKPARVIVQYRGKSDEARKERVRRRGGRWMRDLQLVDGALFDGMAAAAVRDLAKDPDVESISPDRPLQAHMDYTRAALEHRRRRTTDSTVRASPWR